jgi:flagella basal body P-ring formation protein FlgA
MRTKAEIRRLVMGLVILTLLVWATQTLCSQWAFGVETSVKFVPTGEGYRAAGVELRSEATVLGTELRLKQIARWSEADAAALGQTAELVIAHFESGKSVQTFEMDQVRSILEHAGVNVSGINFRGALSCQVTWSDPRLQEAIEQAAEVQANRIAAALRPKVSVVGASGPVESTVAAAGPKKTFRSLREILIADAAERFGLPANSLEVRFRAEDERLANLSEPHFEFQVEPPRRRELGLNSWTVTLVTAVGKEKASVEGNVRAWQTQIYAAKPLGYRQVIREEDVTTQRILVDRLSDEMALSKEQVIGQQASRDIRAGAAINSRLIEPVQLVSLGQLIDVYVERGSVQVKWTAEAREIGSMGQTIRVRKPGTREEFSVVLTGTAQAKLAGGAGGGSVGTKLAGRP